MSMLIKTPSNLAANTTTSSLKNGENEVLDIAISNRIAESNRIIAALKAEITELKLENLKLKANTELIHLNGLEVFFGLNKIKQISDSLLKTSDNMLSIIEESK